MIALFISGPFAALVGFVAATIAIFTAWLLDQSPNAVRAGVFSYNAVLVGQLTAVLFPEMTIVDWIFMVFGTIFSVYFTSSFAALFGSISKHPMPALTAPFVAAQVLVCLSAASPGALYLKTPLPNHIPGSALSNNSLLGGDSSTNTSVQQALVAATDLAFATNDLPASIVFNSGEGIVAMNASMNSIPNPTTVNIETLDWGEAYGQDHLPGSLLMYLGVVISSPTTALMCLFGSTVSTLVGAVLCPGPAESLYAGVWGYNGLLTAAALGGFALVLTPQSAALALMGALLTAAGVPLLTLPFNLAALLLLCATARGGGSLVRPPALTYPEKHRRDWAAARHSKRSRNLSSPSDLSSPDDEVDKKEQFRKLEII
ncbi:Urea transporter, putative [Gryllus bimaculatus]|nr:Urea transporter, putative [Gryllus bimaculatus]